MLMGLKKKPLQAASMPQDMTAQHSGMLEQKKPGINWGNVAVSALGGAADGASRFFGGPSTFAAMQGQQEQMRMQQAAMQQEELQRTAQELAAQRLGYTPDQIAVMGGKIGEVEAARMKPESAPAIQQNADYIRQTQGDEAADNYIRNFGQRPDEPRMVTLPDGRAIFGTMHEIQQILGGGAAQRPARPVGGLMPIEGGTGSNVGGNFR